MGCNSLTYLPIAFRDYQYKKYREALGNKIIKYLRENRTSSKKHQFKFWCFFLFQERLKHWAKRIFANICSVTPKPRAEGSSPSAPAIKGEQNRCHPKKARFYRAFFNFSRTTFSIVPDRCPNAISIDFRS